MTNVRKLQVQYLLTKYVEATASEKEEALLFQLLHEENEPQEWETIVEELMAAEPELNPYDPKQWQQVIDEIVRTKQKAKVKRMPVGLRWIAAASVILIASIVIILSLSKYNTQSSVANRPFPVEKNIQPGTQGAILTLSNGKQIVLDSTKGNIASEGGVAIINKDGSVSYAQSKSSNPKSEIVYNTISTPKGRQYQLSLQDGSKVWLNAASSVRFPTAFAGKNRVVEITGEAYFEVTHDASKPFHVSVNGMDVQVLGTHFNINSYDDEPAMKTTLLQGSVKVSSVRSQVAGRRLQVSRVIKPGEQAVLSFPSTSSGQAISVVSDIDVDQVVAWKNGKFQFGEKSDLPSIMRQIARWYDVDVEFKGTVAQHFGGSVSRNAEISEVLKALETTGSVKFSIEGKKIIVMAP